MKMSALIAALPSLIFSEVRATDDPSKWRLADGGVIQAVLCRERDGKVTFRAKDGWETRVVPLDQIAQDDHRSVRLANDVAMEWAADAARKKSLTDAELRQLGIVAPEFAEGRNYRVRGRVQAVLATGTPELVEVLTDHGIQASANLGGYAVDAILPCGALVELSAKVTGGRIVAQVVKVIEVPGRRRASTPATPSIADVRRRLMDRAEAEQRLRDAQSERNRQLIEDHHQRELIREVESLRRDIRRMEGARPIRGSKLLQHP